jgi:glycosyltransferase involved in cell wall biosynthesis
LDSARASFIGYRAGVTVEVNNRLSIIINNFNYEQFLLAAIQSALDQTWPDTEVIVVDDGSTDGSIALIDSLGDSIIPVLKENGGQASAMNVGLRASSGDVVLFLDADDVLEPDAGSHIMDAFTREPDVAKIQFRLRMIDGDDNELGAVIPPSWQPMPSGDLRAFIVAHRTYVYPPTSGNAFSRAALDQIWPIPEDIFRISADQYLHHATPLVGTVHSMDIIGGSYRIHQSNHYVSRDIDLNRIRTEIVISRDGHPYYREIAERTGLYAYPREYGDVRDRILFGLRLVSLKLDPDEHPISSDKLIGLGLRGIIATIRIPDISIARKILQIVWLTGVTLTPRMLAPWIIKQRMQMNTPDDDDNNKGVISRPLRHVFQWIVSGRRRMSKVDSVDEPD